MRYWLLWATAALLGFGLLGCGDGVTTTRAERAERHKRTFEMDWKQLNDDIDAFLLLDRPSRLTWANVE